MSRSSTTLPKAKELRPVVEKLITLARRAICTRAAGDPQIRDLPMVKKLFDMIGPRYKARNGGYTAHLKAGFPLRRLAPVAVIEFVDRDVEAKGKEDRARHAAEVAARPKEEAAA